MSSKVTSSTTVKGTATTHVVGVGSTGPSAKRLPKTSKKQVMGKSTTPSDPPGERVSTAAEAESEATATTGQRLRNPILTRVGCSPSPFDDPEDQVIMHVVPPSSPVQEETLTDPENEIEYHGHPTLPEDHDPGDPTSASTSTPGGSVLNPDSSRTGDPEEVVNESDQFLDEEEDCSEECDEDDEDEEEISSEELGEEEEDEDDEGEDEDEEDEEDAVTDELSEEEVTQPSTPRKPLPQHRPQLPIIERTHNNKRRGRTPGGSGLSIGNAASAIKRVRGIAGIRATKCTSTAAGAIGKSKATVSSLRKNRRAFAANANSNTNPIFLHNTSSDEDEAVEEEEVDEEEEEVDDEEDDMGDEYLEREESDEEEEDEDGVEPPGFLLSADGDPSALQNIPPDAQARLEAFFEAAGFTDGKLMSDPESLRKLTLTVSSALGEASAAINRMRDSQRKSVEEGRSDSLEEGDSLLALACSSGYFELARVLLAMGANVDDRGSKGDLTPLMDAASQGHLEIVRLLLSHGADVNAQSACGNSALMYACASGHVSVVEELLKAGAHVEDNNENGHTPLMEAASAGYVPVAKVLLSQGAGINTHSNEFKESALTVACYKGHLEMVRFLLEAGADQQHKTDEMHTALMEASMDGHVEVARLLLDSGAQVNMPADSFESPLTLAACGGHVELAELLLERGANIEEVNDEGYTPLMEAAREGHICVVKTLLKHHALVNAKTEETQETALTLAACGGFLDVVDLLLKAGADIEFGASTPLMEAAQEGHIQVVRFLIEKGADIFRENTAHDIALSFAAENGHLDIVQLFVDLGCQHEHLSEGGRSPLMKAARGGHIDVIKYFLGKKADVNRQTTSNDHTPLSLACAGGHLAAVELLLAVGANPYHKLKDNSTMIIEAARGGHTPVIRCLLDYLPPNVKAAGAKAQALAKQGQAMAKVAAPGQAMAKGAPPGQAVAKGAPPGHAMPKGAPPGQATKTAVDPKLTQQTKASPSSVLRKCRSTSTLDSALPAVGVPGKESGDAKPAGKAAHVQPVAPCTKEGHALLKGGVVDPKTLPGQILTTTDGKGSCVTDGKAPAAAVGPSEPNQSLALAKKPPSTVAGMCSDCCKSSTVASEVQQALPIGQVHVKRPAAPEPMIPTSPQQLPPSTSITVGTVTPTSPSAFVPVSSTGPPLVASQVTAATAISERPKLKSKPRKTSQLQNQGQMSGPGNQGSTSAATSPGSSSEKSQTLSPAGSPGSPQSPSQGQQGVVPTVPGASKGPALPLGTPGMVQQVLTNTGSSMDLKDLKLDTKQLTQIFAQHQQQFLKKGAALLQGQGNLDQLSGTGAAGSTTTTTTTVVVTHGNGETETIFDGENLPPGANEVIMNAAAAAFPLDCFPLPSALQMGQSGEVHVQSYQVGGSGDGSTTTMQTTTIINAATSLNNFPLNILPHHPPPLPAAIAAAAAAAGLVPASGAPPPGALKAMAAKKMESQQPMKAVPPFPPTPAPKISGTSAPPGQPPIPVNQVPPVSSLAAPVGQKKQLAKRSRPLAQSGSCSRQSQQTQTHAHAHGHAHGKHNQSVASTQTTITGQQANPHHFDVNNATESGGETSLTIAAASGHYEVVEFLLGRKANIEHRDKKGCTSLILASDGGYDKVVELLLTRGADIEAQSERTKDTALSLGCTKGRFEVVDLLIKKGANKEHRNVSDYTPLSLAASGGYVNIIKLLLQNGAEINSRTGSKLGISPLMLAAMNGNTSAVKLLLDMGSDINAQIETNKNTALTLACFQGRQEVVALLLERKANLEHRAKTGLTPLMEAANGGYTEVGKILIEKGADVNAAPVPATKDTALTIAADKGHYRFVELLLSKGAMVEVRNKKGCTPMWLACNGGHLDVSQILFKHHADLDIQDNRKVSCLMAAFRKGHVKVIRWVVKNVQQFPSDAEMLRFYASIQGEADLLKKSQQCGEFVKQAKDKQALEANKNANILLEELDLERCREESKRQAAARRREKKKKKKQEKRHGPAGEHDDDDDEEDEDDDVLNINDSGIDANSLASNSSTNGKNKENVSRKERDVVDETQEPKLSAKSRKRKNRKERERQNQLVPQTTPVPLPLATVEKTFEKKVPLSSVLVSSKDILKEKDNKLGGVPPKLDTKSELTPKVKEKKTKREATIEMNKVKEEPIVISSSKTKESGVGVVQGSSKKGNKPGMEVGKDSAAQYFEPAVSNSRKMAANFDLPDSTIFSAFGYVPPPFVKSPNGNSQPAGSSGNMKSGRKDDGWKEVTRSFPSSRSKKVMVPSSVISRVIGRGGCNINAIREATGAHIEVEKQQKGQAQPERTIQIKGTVESTKQAHALITALMNEPDLDVKKLFPLSSAAATSSASVGTPFTTGTFSVPATSVATTSSQRPSANAPITTSTSSPTSFDNMPFTTFVSNPTPGKSNAKSSKTAVSPPVTSQASLMSSLQNPTTPVNGSSTTTKGGTPVSTGKKPTLFVQSGKTPQGSGTGSTVAPSNPFVSKPSQQHSAMHIFTPNGHRLQQGSTTPTASAPASSTPSASPVPSTSPSLGSGSGDLKLSFSSGSTVGNPAQFTNTGLDSPTNIMTGQQAKDSLNLTQGSPNGMSSFQTQPSSTSPVQMTRSMAPGSSVIGPPGSGRSTSAAENTESTNNSTIQEPQPLEYSPFNYTFSKTAGWFPGDLAQPNYMTSNSQTMGSPLGHIGSGMSQHPHNSSAARAMNFASVAASGISATNLSTATAQMTHAGGLQNGGLVGSLGTGLSSSVSLGGNTSLETELPKVDASKAPGYRGNTMGSPVLRSLQQQQNPCSTTSENNSQFGGLQSSGGIMNLGNGQTLMGFGGSGGRSSGGMNIGVMSGLPNNPNFGMSGIGHEMGSGMSAQQGSGNSMMYGNTSGGLPSPTGISSPQAPVVSSSTVPTNVIMSSRLNPRAPSFTLSQHSKLGPPTPPQVPNFQQQQQLPPLHSQQHQIYNSFKMNNSFGSRNNNVIPGGRQGNVTPGMNMSTGWNPYGNDSSVVDLQNLAALASATGTLDPQVLFSPVDPIGHDNQQQSQMKGDVRLPRPIGGERAWKNTGSNPGNLNNMTPFSTLDCLESGQLSQPMSTTQSHPGQGQGWLGPVYGPPQPFLPVSNQNPNSGIHGNHQRGGGDARNFLGRRFMDEMEVNRIAELQQMMDGQHRMMNGGLGPPGPMHMGGNMQHPPMMFPFGPPTDHMEPHLAPKVDQHINSWDAHVHNLEEKQQHLGWGGKWGN